MNSINVLLMDDQSIFENIFSQRLNSLNLSRNFELTYCDNPEETTKIVENENFDVIFLDYRVDHDELNGLDVLNSLRAKDFEGPIFLLSGEGEENVSDEALEKGATDFLSKMTLDEDSLREILVENLDEVS